VPKGAKIVQAPQQGGALFKNLPGAQPGAQPAAAAKPATPAAPVAPAPVSERKGTRRLREADPATINNPTMTSRTIGAPELSADPMQNFKNGVTDAKEFYDLARKAGVPVSDAIPMAYAKGQATATGDIGGFVKTVTDKATGTAEKGLSQLQSTIRDYADLYAQFQFFMPEDSIDLIPNHYLPIYHQAVKSGILRLTPGNVTDLNEIEHFVTNQCSIHNVKEIGYDPYNAAALVANLFGSGLPVKKVGQGMAVLSNPSKTAEQLILKKGIKHDGNPFVGWQLSNCEVYTDVNGNVKVRKNEADPSAKVDGIIALIMALHCHLDNVFVNDSYGFRLF
jgi:hypothetical protein